MAKSREPQGHSHAANREPCSKFGSLVPPGSPQNRALPDTVTFVTSVRNSFCPVCQGEDKCDRFVDLNVRGAQRRGYSGLGIYPN